MSNTHSLVAEDRVLTGSGPAKELRRRSMIPGIIYGPGKPQVMISLPFKELTLELHKPGFLSHIFEIQVGKTKYSALPKDVQLHPVTDEIEHIDFVHVDKNTKLKTSVVVHFINEEKCQAIKLGGILNVAMHNLEIFALPSSIPESIEVDIAELTIGQSIKVSDIVLPKGVETKIDPHANVAAIVAGKVEAAAEAEEETAAE